MESGWQLDMAQGVIEDGCKARLKGPLGRTRKNTLHADSRSRFSRARPDRGADLGWEYDECGEVRHAYSLENSFNVKNRMQVRYIYQAIYLRYPDPFSIGF